jgi:rSAM/selenodomain-associated transferase 2
MPAPWLSIVIPALNEAATVGELLQLLQPWRQRGVEIILVDGGSSDETVTLAAPWVDVLLEGERGRARQQNQGAAAARADLLWFVHADTRFAGDPVAALEQLAGKGNFTGWGRFDVRPDVSDRRLRLVTTMMNLRSRYTGIATGDQGIFVSRTLFRQVGGFPAQPLMEDVEISARLKRCSRPWCVSRQLVIHTRRWRDHGVWRTVWQMWWLRARYFFGADPAALHREYYRGR